MAEDSKKSGDESDGKKSGGSKKKLIIIVSIVALIAVGAGVGVTLMLKSKHDDKVADQSHGGGKAEAESAPKTPPVYMPFSPAFVVNFQPAKNVRARFLSVELDAVVTDKEMTDQIKTNMPAVRNAIIMLLSKQTYADLIKPEGKEKLRGEILGQVQKVMKETTGKPSVKDIYFTSFVMQ
jgi:flagellar FliL protein